MERIEEMITPKSNWVKCKLGDVVKLRRGKRLVKRELDETGTIPVYQNSLQPLGYYKCSNTKANTTFIICAGAAGEIGYSNIDFWSADDCFVVESDETICNKYIYYFLLTKQNSLKSKVRRASIPRLSHSDIEELEIPLPPLQIQEEIVKVLDKFTNLESELEAELAKREKQFEYYRELLLTPKKEWKECKLGDFLNPLRGKRLTKKQLDDSNIYPVYHGGLEPIGYYDKSNREKDTVMIINVGASAGTVGYSDKDFWSSDGCFCLSKNNDLNTRFVYFYLQLNEKSIKSKVRVAGIPTLDSSAIMNIDFSFPPIDEQKRIVGILDKFDKLINDKNEGLQKEIELRKIQYEYYRNKLLTF